MPLPIQEESYEALRARFDVALEQEWTTVETALSNRPGMHRPNVFDTDDGYRLIVGREMYPDGVRMIHISVSAFAVTRAQWANLRTRSRTPTSRFASREDALNKIFAVVCRIAGRQLPEPEIYISKGGIVHYTWPTTKWAIEGS